VYQVGNKDKINDDRCTCEIKSRITKAKAAFKKNYIPFTGLKFTEEVVK
jgi:hypothetical protein